VQAGDSLVTVFLDIYNNWLGDQGGGQGPIAYVAPGINTPLGPPFDAFNGEARYTDTTAGAQWASSLPGQKHDVYYLYRLFAGTGIVNQHVGHGMIVVFKI
jgi:hypothetical protein